MLAKEIRTTVEILIWNMYEESVTIEPEGWRNTKDSVALTEKFGR